MQAPAWSVWAATRRNSFRWASNRRPAHRLGRDRLLHPVVDGQSLQMRKRLLEGQSLLVKLLPGTPELKRDVPPRLFAGPPDDRDDLLEPADVMRLQHLDPRRGVRERAAMRRQDELWLVGREPPEPVQVLVQRIWGALGMQPDVRR